MVDFAPAAPLGDIPNYIRLAGTPISQPEADKSKAIGISTLATGISEGTQAAEQTEQDYLRNKVRAGVDTIRDSTTAAYENIRNAQVTGQQPAQGAMQTAGFTGSLLGQVGSNVPEGLQAGLDKMGATGTAIAQSIGGRANDTLYTAQLNSMAKQLRAEYPGHRDFIDQQVAQISGKNPANAYMDNLLQDINRNAAAGNTNRNKLLGQAYELMGTAPDIQHSIWPYIKAYEMNLPGSEDNLARAVNTGRYQDYKFKSWKQDREVKQAGQQDQSFDAKQQYGSQLQTMAFREFNALVEIPGLSSPQTIQKLIDDQREGRITLNAQQSQQLLMAAKSAEDRFNRHAKDMAASQGYSSAINNPAEEKAIRDNESSNFHNLVEAIGNKDWGTLFEAKRNIEAIQNDTQQALYNDKDMGAYWRTHQAVTQIGGPNMANFLDSIGLQRKYLGNLQSFVNNEAKVSAAPDDLRNDGKVKSMYGALQQLQDASRRGLSDPKVIAKAYHDVVHLVDNLTAKEANPAVQKEIVKYAFGENNFKTLDTARMDFVDSSGKRHDGKYSVFDALTQPNITQKIRSLNDSQSWNAYKNWGETSFAQLYREDLSSMASISGEKSIPMRVTWDSTNNRFAIDDGKGGPVRATTNVEQNTINYANSVINRLNGGLYNLSQIHKAEGGSPTATSAYLLNTMIRSGFDPEKVGGFPADVYEAIKNSKAKKDLSTAFEKASGK